MAFNLNKLVQPECGAPNPLVAAAQQITMRPSSSSSMAVAGSSSRLRHNKHPTINFAKEFLNQTNNISGSESSMSHSKVAGAHQTATNFLYQNHLSSSNQQIPLTNTSNNTQQTLNLVNPGKLATDFLAEHELADGVDRIRMANLQYGASDLMGPSMLRSSILSASMNHSNQAMMNYNMGISSQIMHTKDNLSNQTSLGDQLETKYRNDMISQSSTNHQQDRGKLDDVEFWQTLSQQYIGPNTYDTIAKMKARQQQQPSTSTEAIVGEQTEKAETKLGESVTSEMLDEALFDKHEKFITPSDMEYVFDERNPLKDQFDDPFQEGLEKLQQGDIPSAALLFEAAVQKEPQNALAWRYLGTTQAQNEKDMSAIRALKNCLKLDPSDLQARLAISVSLANETYHHEACENLIHWLNSHEKYRSVGATLEKFHEFDSELSNDPFYMNSIDLKHYKYVRDKFVEAARMSPSNPDPEVQSSLGVLFNMKGEYDKAVDCFKAALSVKSDDSLLWNRLGATLANGNKSDEAVIAYRKALEISPGFLRSRYNLAISLIHLNTYDEAAKQLVQILNMQAAGKGSKNSQIRTRSITSTAIWNTLRTVATLLNKPELYPIIDGRDLARCNEEIFKTISGPSTN